MTATLPIEILRQLLTYVRLPFSDVTGTEEDDFVRLEIVSENPSRIIGWHGETLNALQQLVKSIVRTKENLDRAPFIILDVDGYRKDQEERVRTIAEQKADFVRRTGNRIALTPMSPYFRRIVHLHVAHSPLLQDLTTFSLGEGEYRQVILKLKEEKVKVGEELSPVLAKEEGLENLDV